MTTVEIASLFATFGFQVFPLYKLGSKSNLKPYGWAKNDTVAPENKDKVIPATGDLAVIQSWPELIRDKYNNAEISGFGILGEGCLIIDIDTKGEVNGLDSFVRMMSLHNIPKPQMITTSKSGGMHAFYKRSARCQDLHVKTLAGVQIDGIKFDGVDLRGNTGFVVGPNELGDGKPTPVMGKYIGYKPQPISELPEFPDKIVLQWTRDALKSEIDNLLFDAPDMDDYRAKIRRGIIPDFIPMGARNDAFYLFTNVLKSRGVPRDAAREMLLMMSKNVENPESFDASVNIDELLDRTYVINKENPYDIAVDLINLGLTQLTNYKSKLHYVILEDNPYIQSRVPHDESTMKSLLAGFQKQMQTASGKEKIVNPMEVVVRIIKDENRADTIGFKPNAGTIFSLHDDPGSTRYLNTYKPIPIIRDEYGLDFSIWDEFTEIVSRIFGPRTSDEYQLGLDFIAWLVQKPHIKPSIAPFIMSHNRGVGKSLFFNTVIHILGTSKAGNRQGRLTKLDELQGRFFDPSGCILNLIDEVQFPVHKDTRKESVTFWRHLKNLITAEVISVEIKGGSTYQVPNSAAMILAGNTGSHFPIEEMDRRLWIIDANPPQLERGVADRLFNITKGVGLGPDERINLISALRYKLHKHKIKNDLDMIRAPMTDVKRDIFMNSLTDIEEWFVSHFENVDNLFAASPVISESAFTYVAETSDRLVGTRWRENVNGLFRDLKRRGFLRPIRAKSSNNVSRNLIVPRIGSDGQLYQHDRREVLYTTREHGKFDSVDNGVITQAFMRNAHTIKIFKGNIKKSVVQDKWEDDPGAGLM